MNLNQIPDEWKLVLEQIQLKYPSAVIAGGSLRDLSYGKPPKDVDIFVPLKSDQIDCETFLSDIEDHLDFIDPNFVRGPVTMYNAAFKGSPAAQRGVVSVHRITNRSIGFDVIVIENKGRPVIDDFDMSINQIQFDGLNLDTTPAFELTQMDNYITITFHDIPEREAKRVERIRAKFPEMKIEGYDNQRN